MSEMVLKLALQAMADEDALPVLADALHESGWKAYPRVAAVIGHRVSPYFQDHQEGTWARWWSSLLLWEPYVAARAIAAVLLFEGWPTSWPLAMRTIVAMPFTFLTNEEMSEGDILVHSGGVWSYLRNAPVIVQPTPDEVGRHQHDPLTVALQSPKERDSG